MLLRQNNIVSLENQYERCANAALTPNRRRRQAATAQTARDITFFHRFLQDEV